MHALVIALFLGAAAAQPAPEPPVSLAEVQSQDRAWREAARRGVKSRATQTQLEAAAKLLERAIKEAGTRGSRDELWLEARASLGLLLFARYGNDGWRKAWPHLQAALEAYAAAGDDGRYKALALGAVFPFWADDSFYRYFQVRLPGDVLARLERLELDADERAAVSFLRAMTLVADRRPQSAQPAEQALVAALTAGPTVEWYDHALFAYAELLERCGKDPGRASSCQPDYHRALEIYRRLVSEQPRSSRVSHARSRIEWITRVELTLGVSHTFLPGSEVPLSIAWRNMPAVDVEVFRVDLLDDRGSGSPDWPRRIDLGGKTPVAAWQEPADVACDHLPGARRVMVKPKLDPGAYVVAARGGGRTVREGLLVTDLTVLLRTDRRQAAVFVASALDGTPVADAKVVVWGGSGGRGKTDENGRARFELGAGAAGRPVFVAAEARQQQLFAASSFTAHPADTWRLLAVAERPAFRPGDLARYKASARLVRHGELVTPAGEAVAFELHDPRRQTVAAGQAKLSEFGSFTGELLLSDKMTLGEYRLRLFDRNKKRLLAEAPLFRLEEYKLPEFVVSVAPPVERQRAKVFKPGDAIEVEISVEHYFGGGVPNAAVEATVQMTPFAPSWEKEREQPWLFGDVAAPAAPLGGRGWFVERKSLRTDAQGKAKVTFSAPAKQRGNMEYWITATVTDSSRRQVTGSGSVRVTEEPYFVFAEAQRAVWGPGEKATVDFVTYDGNRTPTAAAGEITVDRLAATGKPAYERLPVTRAKLTADASGRASFSFLPPQPGYYQVLWRRNRPGAPAAASVLLHVTGEKTADLGYRSHAVELIPDRDTYRPGDTALVLVHAPFAPLTVWLALEGDQLYEDEVLRLDDFAATMRVKLTADHAPFLFFDAQFVEQLAVQQSSTSVVVLPPDPSLRVRVSFDQPDYRPGASGKARLAVEDVAGKPVRAEVSLAIFDEAVLAIQPEYIGDPRPLFLTAVRQSQVRSTSTFGWRSYVRLSGEDPDRLSPASFPRRSSRVPVLPPILEPVTYDPGLREVVPEPEPEPSYADDDGAYDSVPTAAAPGAAMAAEESSVSRSAPPAPSRAKSADRAPRRDAKRQEVTPGATAFRAPESVTVRADFRATVYWNPTLVTNRKGQAEVALRFPESLTRWQATAFGLSRGPDVGRTTAQVRTHQPLMIRLQAPRFFVVGDRLTISAIVNNHTDEPLTTIVSLKAPRLQITEARAGATRAAGHELELAIGAQMEQRVDFAALVTEPGPTALEVMVRSANEADAMRKSLPAYAHGIDKLLAGGGKVQGGAATVTMELPPRAPGSTDVVVQVSPTLAVTMLDALPYLIDFPYGCTEQTISRFVPLALVRRTLQDLGLKPAEVQNRLFGGIEAAHVAKTQPKGKKELGQLDLVIAEGLARIIEMQRPDHGWGWWKENTSDPFMTAYALWGLLLAREAGVPIKENVLRQATNFLEWQLGAVSGHLEQGLVLREQARRTIEGEEDTPERALKITALLEQAEQLVARSDLELVAWLLHVASVDYATAERQSFSDRERRLFFGLFGERARLSSYGVALLALTAYNYRQEEEAGTLADLLIQTAKRDFRPSDSLLVKHKAVTSAGELAWAFWGEPSGWRRWYQSPVETTAMALRALVRIRPEHAINEQAMTWLVVNRRGAQWNNTRDTALSIYALTDYLTRRRPPQTGAAYRVVVNGVELTRQKLGAAQLWRAPSRFTVPEKLLKDGANEIVIENLGRSELFYATYATFFTLEEPVVAAGNLLFIERQYELLPRDGGAPTRLRDRATLQSGDRVRVTLTAEAKNELEYLMVEDLKPAGFEALEVQSGYGLTARHFDLAPRAANDRQSHALDLRRYTGQSEGLYRELRDRQVALFARRLSPGFWEISYELRAEVPGEFHALPPLGRAMYVPEVRGNGTEVRVTVRDQD